MHDRDAKASNEAKSNKVFESGFQNFYDYCNPSKLFAILASQFPRLDPLDCKTHPHYEAAISHIVNAYPQALFNYLVEKVEQNKYVKFTCVLVKDEKEIDSSKFNKKPKVIFTESGNVHYFNGSEFVTANFIGPDKVKAIIAENNLRSTKKLSFEKMQNIANGTNLESFLVTDDIRTILTELDASCLINVIKDEEEFFPYVQEIVDNFGIGMDEARTILLHVIARQAKECMLEDSDFLMRFPRVKKLFEEDVELSSVIRAGTNFFSLVDEDFIQYNGNWVVPGRVAALQGPQTDDDVELLLQSILNNDIKHIVPVVNSGDVVEYFMGPVGQKKKFGIFEVEVLETAVNEAKIAPLTNNELKQNPNASQFRKIQLRIRCEEDVNDVTIHFFRAIDNTHPVNVNCEADVSAMCDLVQLFLKGEKIAVHCRAGLGRTASMTLPMALAKKYYEDNVSELTAEDKAQALAEMRTRRPGSILMEEQFHAATRLTDVIFSRLPKIRVRISNNLPVEVREKYKRIFFANNKQKSVGSVREEEVVCVNTRGCSNSG